MSLEISHGTWSGSQTQFRRWRNAVAVAAGYTLMPAVSQIGQDIEVPYLAWETFTRDNFEGSWGPVPADPLLVLLVHSDSSGLIDPDTAVLLADRLEQIVLSLPSADGYDFHAERTAHFIRGLRDAAAAGLPVEFTNA